MLEATVKRPGKGRGVVATRAYDWPHDTKGGWWYEDVAGIDVYGNRTAAIGRPTETTHVLITWQALSAALRRRALRRKAKR